MKYLAITAILCLILAGASFAGNVTMTEVITSGNLTLTMPNNFSLTGTTLGGTQYPDTSGGANYIVEDSRGTGAGWNLGLQMSQFVTSGTPQRSLNAAWFTVEIQAGDITATYGQAVDGANGPKTLIPSAINVAGTEVKSVTALAQLWYG